MWDWFSALNDGGMGLLLGAALATCAVTLLHRVARDNPAWWEFVLPMVGVYVLFSAYPAWELLFSTEEWHRFPLDGEASALTYGKELWLNLWGVLTGRIAYSILGAWFIGRH